MQKDKKYLFCYNQVSFAVACEVAKKNTSRSKIIVDPDRVKTPEESKLDIVSFSPLLSLFILFTSFLSNHIEVIIPHAKGGRLFRWIARYARNISYVDDGMDTFRSIPRNIDLKQIKGHPKYYTFNYDIPTAAWLSNFNVMPVCSIKQLMENVRPALDVTGIDTLVIESPSVNLNEDFSPMGNVCFFRHTNSAKNQDVQIDDFSVSGLDYSLEKTLVNFKGKLLIGETMALIFSFAFLPKETDINLYLTRVQYDNLACLQGIIRDRVTLYLDGEKQQ